MVVRTVNYVCYLRRASSLLCLSAPWLAVTGSAVEMALLDLLWLCQPPPLGKTSRSQCPRHCPVLAPSRRQKLAHHYLRYEAGGHLVNCQTDRGVKSPSAVLVTYFLW